MKITRTITRYLLAAMMMMAATGALRAAEIHCGRVVVFTDRDIYIAGEQLLFTLHINGESGGQTSASGEIVYLLLRDSRQGPVAKVCMKTAGGMAYGSISLPDTLATGYYQLVAFTNRLRNCGEDCYFSKELIIANLFDRELKALSDANPAQVTAEGPVVDKMQQPAQSLFSIRGLKKTYAQGEEISFSLAGNSSSGNLPAITVSVAEEEPWQGKISGYNFGQSCSSRSTQMEFLPETRGQIISGKVTDKATHAGIENCCVLLSAKDTAVNLQYAFTGSNGMFRFRLNDYYQQKDIVIQLLDSVPGQKPVIELEDRFALSDAFVPAAGGISAAVAEYIRRSQDIVRVQRAYRQAPQMQAVEKTAGNNLRPALYYKPDQQVFPGAYESLSDFSEITKELLPTVRTRKTASGTTLEVVDKVQQGFFSKNAALFIDGIYRRDNREVLPMGSDRIRRIEVVNEQRVYGTLTFPGILAVFTNDSAIAPATDQSSKLFRVEPYSANSVQQQQEIPRNTTLPDFRQLLYWQPVIKAGQAGSYDIKFRASQHTGTFILSIRGTGADGEIIQKEQRFSIR